MIGEIPQSNALAQASPESITELLTRDPMGYARQDRVRIIEHYRELRAIWAKAEANGEHKKSSKSGGTSGGRALLKQAPDEMDL